MKLILISDPHITSKQPRHRKGNVLEDSKRKLEDIFKYAKDYSANIICSGDLFDSPRDIKALFAFIEVKSKYPDIDFYTVYGQHDMYMRNKTVLNNLLILSKAKQIKILSETPIRKGNVNIYGTSWKDKVPSPEANKINVLAIHSPISSKRLNHEYTPAIAFLKKHKFNLILAGDIHFQFIEMYIEPNSIRIIANTGPMLRLNRTEDNLNHAPSIMVYDINQRKITNTIELTHSIDVFDSRFSFYNEEDSIIDEDMLSKFGKAYQEGDDIYSYIMLMAMNHENHEDILKILEELEKDHGFK